MRCSLSSRLVTRSRRRRRRVMEAHYRSRTCSRDRARARRRVATSRAAIAWRLSPLVRPLPTPSSTLTRPSLKYRLIGTSDTRSVSISALSRRISSRCSSSLRGRSGACEPNPCGVRVRRDVHALEPCLAVADAGVRVGELHLRLAHRLDLAALQHDARLEHVGDRVVAPRLTVAGDQLGAGLGALGGFDLAMTGSRLPTHGRHGICCPACCDSTAPPSTPSVRWRSASIRSRCAG